MEDSYARLLRNKMDDVNYKKLMALANPEVNRFVAEAIALCGPESIFICTDSKEDIQYVREQALARGEERPLRTPGHTYHFDGMKDQGRDRSVTKYLVPKGDHLSKALNQIPRDVGLPEIQGFLKNAMKGKMLIVRFLSLGPTNSVFSIPCVQCTDSFYVAHSEDLLYRPAYEEFRRRGAEGTKDFFRFLHSAGKLNANMVSVETDKKRIYIDYSYNTIYSVNTQYAGNTVGLKKLALRLTIRKADREGWLAEHMFLIGVRGPGGRKTYFGGAFPSACGKTSTAMLPGETILGDDIAYFRVINGEVRAVNAEAGIFGIIQNVSPTSDVVIYEALTRPGEVIFSNVLVKDGRPYWLGMGIELPKEGENFSGHWYEGKKDDEDHLIPPAHENARYTISLRALANVDSELENPDGVRLEGIMYGGRDAHGYVPVQQSFDWAHGIVTYGGSLETVPTYAIVDKTRDLEINVMSIQDFLSIPIGRYVRNNLEFVKGVKRPPLIFGVNYFLINEKGQYMNDLRDKAVWVKWMELRVHNEVGAIKGPTGWLPRYEDLRRLFRQVLNKDYTREDYNQQFAIRVPQLLAKMDRVEKFYRAEGPTVPSEVFEQIEAQRQRLREVQRRFGDIIAPDKLCE